MPRPHDDGAESTSTYQPLLDTESSLVHFLAEPAITTVTFFKGAVDAKSSSAWLKDRLTAICHDNPWLTGQLVKNKKIHKNVLLEIPSPIPTDEDINAIICNGDSAELSRISSKSKYEDIANAILKSDAVVGPGYKLIGKRDHRVAKFTLIQMDNKDEVALIASITHAISDGYTYYKIMSMLNGDIEELSPVRKHDFITASIDAIGAKEHKFLSSTSFMICCLKSMLCGSKPNMDARYIDQDKVILCKEKVQDGFVSTNDIVTSSFARATKVDILLMAINLRNRVKGTNENDAGNYESVILHDSKSASTPQALRKTLTGGAPFKRAGDTALPGVIKTVRSKVGMMTNWSFLDVWEANLKLFDSSGDQTIPIALHLPVYNIKDIAFPTGIIFRANPDRVAIMYGGSARDITYDKLIDAGCPIAEPVSTEMFPVE
eukprot:scaffold47924_cov41-Cyclotella_meneghiniana.AAC.1